MTNQKSSSGERVVVLNPVAGSGDHEAQVRDLADEHGFDVLASEEAHEAITLAEEAAGASLVAACGGDGTLNEVARGLWQADALEETTLGVVPAGTGNNFAEKIGVESIPHAFEVLTDGERRYVDLGTADADTAEGTRPFVNSCICGITAEASVDTDPDQKSRLGTLAYVFNTLQEAGSFDPIPLRVETSDEIETTWDGEAIAVLVGNGRRFPAEGPAQANMEDGLLDITILENHPTSGLVGGEAKRRLLDESADHLTRLQTPALELDVQEGETASFSLDGEMLEASDVTLAAERQRLWLRVGEGYDSDPDY